jgi:hypothetical protein
MTELIEIDNSTTKSILVSACRSKTSGRLYVHLGKAHGNEAKVKPSHYVIVEVREVSA